MSLSYIKGDLFLTQSPIIAHGCNVQGVMGAGVAKIVKQKYPWAFQDYAKFCARRQNYPSSLLGSFCLSRDPSDTVAIAHLMTQAETGNDGRRYVSYDAVDSSLNLLANHLKATTVDPGQLPSIAMPKIGAGLGGGKWEVIAEIIEHRLADFRVAVWEL